MIVPLRREPCYIPPRKPIYILVENPPAHHRFTILFSLLLVGFVLSTFIAFLFFIISPYKYMTVATSFSIGAGGWMLALAVLLWVRSSLTPSLKSRIHLLLTLTACSVPSWTHLGVQIFIYPYRKSPFKPTLGRSHAGMALDCFFGGVPVAIGLYYLLNPQACPNQMIAQESGKLKNGLTPMSQAVNTRMATSPGQAQAANFAFYSLLIRWTACLSALTSVFLFEAFTSMFSFILAFITYFVAAMILSTYQTAPIEEEPVAKKRLLRDLVHLSGYHMVFMAVRCAFFRDEFMGYPVVQEEFIAASLVDLGFAASLLGLGLYFYRS